MRGVKFRPEGGSTASHRYVSTTLLREEEEPCSAVLLGTEAGAPLLKKGLTSCCKLISKHTAAFTQKVES
ncbi:hypothetical protein AOLI_G00188940 [Acnodon oligacanthus]